MSRPHVRTLLRDAEAQGLIARSGKDGSVLLKPHFAIAVGNFFANSLLYVAHCALQASDEVRRVPGSAGRQAGSVVATPSSDPEHT